MAAVSVRWPQNNPLAAVMAVGLVCLGVCAAGRLGACAAGRTVELYALIRYNKRCRSYDTRRLTALQRKQVRASRCLDAKEADIDSNLYFLVFRQ